MKTLYLIIGIGLTILFIVTLRSNQRTVESNQKTIKPDISEFIAEPLKSDLSNTDLFDSSLTIPNFEENDQHKTDTYVNHDRVQHDSSNSSPSLPETKNRADSNLSTANRSMNLGHAQDRRTLLLQIKEKLSTNQ